MADQNATVPGMTPISVTGTDEISAPPVLEPGSQVGEYRITGTIAAGGCGTVYAAEHRVLGRKAAVKVLHPEMSMNAAMVQRFIREARVVNQIHHPNVVDIFDFGELKDRRPYFVMELLEGVTLGKLVRTSGSLSPAQIVEYLEPVCRALDAAHKAGVVHRDLKPSNIAVVFSEDRPPMVKLLDFGIAKLLRPEPGEPGLTVAGQRLGTPTAMAPEQIRGENVDARVDIYALGVMLYFCLVGRYPFEGENATDVERMHIDTPAPRPSRSAAVSPLMDEIVLKCMEKAPDRRYPNIAAFLEALRAAAGTHTEVSKPPSLSAPGVAIYVEAELPADADLDVLSLVDDALERAEDELLSAGYRVSLQTSNALLGTRVLPTDEAAARDERRAGLTLAASLHRAIQPPEDPPPFRIRCTLHVDRAEFRETAEGNEVTGGDLLRVERWPRPDGAAVFATPQAAQGLEQA